MFKSIRKNIRQRKLNKLNKILMYGLLTGSVTLYNGVCFADDTEDTTPPRFGHQRRKYGLYRGKFCVNRRNFDYSKHNIR